METEREGTKTTEKGKRKNRSERKEAEKGAEGGRWVRETVAVRYMM